MSKVLNFTKLDFITIKPYLTGRNVFIFAFVSLALAFGTNSSGGSVGYFMILGMIFSSYPFAVCEQSGMDTLYATLSTKRDDVVIGRYIFASSLIFLCGVAISVILVIISLATGNFTVGETLGAVLVCFALFSFVEFFQLPMLFKLGYTKAKAMIYIPLVLIALIGAVMVFTMGKENFYALVDNMLIYFTENKGIAVLSGIVIYALCFCVSLFFAREFYQNRDF